MPKALFSTTALDGNRNRLAQEPQGPGWGRGTRARLLAAEALAVADGLIVAPRLSFRVFGAGAVISPAMPRQTWSAPFAGYPAGAPEVPDHAPESAPTTASAVVTVVWRRKPSRQAPCEPRGRGPRSSRQRQPGGSRRRPRAGRSRARRRSSRCRREGGSRWRSPRRIMSRSRPEEGAHPALGDDDVARLGRDGRMNLACRRTQRQNARSLGWH